MGRPTHETVDNEDSLLPTAAPPRRKNSLPMKPKVAVSRSNANSNERAVSSNTDPAAEKVRSRTTRARDQDIQDNNKSSSKAKGERAATHRQTRTLQDLASDEPSVTMSDYEESEDFRPGAQHVGGNTDEPLSTPFSVRSEKSANAEQIHDEEGLMTAIPIDDDEEEQGQVVSDDLKAKLQEEAREKVLQGVAKAKEETEEDLKRQAEAKCGRRCAIAGVVACFSIILVAAGVLYFLFAVNKDTTEAVTMSPTVAPTVIPPIFNPGETEHNNLCDEAFSLDDTVGTPIFGSTMNATSDDVEACEIVSKNGNGVWYRLPGDGRRMMASTCDKTFFDTQISIFRGACGKLQCVSGNDQISCGNGDQSQVAWFAEPGVDYFVMVHGHRDATGLFELAVDAMDDNDQCGNAQLVTLDTPAVFGSTRGATNDNKTSLDLPVVLLTTTWKTVALPVKLLAVFGTLQPGRVE